MGPATVCPYCDQESVLLPMHRVLRVGALVLALCGSLSLYLAARFGDVPLVRTGDVSAMMNHAYVRIAGAVAAPPYVGRRDGRVDYVSFVVDDGTGRIRVCAYDEVACALLEGGRLPERGTVVAAAGSVRCSGPDRTRLSLRTARDLRSESAGRELEEAAAVARSAPLP